MYTCGYEQLLYYSAYLYTYFYHYVGMTLYKYTLILPSIVLKKASAVYVYDVGLSTQLLYYFYTCGLQSRTGDVNKFTNNVKEMGVEPSISRLRIVNC